MDSSPVRRVVELALIGVFLTAISLPLVGKLLPAEGSFALTENRRPAPLPTIRLGGPGWGWSIASFPRRFERYWNDSFAFRWYLIRAHSIAKLALGASPSPKVTLGKMGFLYYADQGSVDYFRGTRPFTEQELAWWIGELERRKRALSEHGVRHLVVIAPNKETIYPEHMPDVLRQVGDESRLDQLLREVRRRSSVEILDLRPVLRDAKTSQRVYHATDTHWNDAGAIVAARAIVDWVSRQSPEFERKELRGSFVTRSGPGGDLARMLALEDRFREEYIEWKPAAAPRSSATSRPVGRSDELTVHTCPDCRGPVVVMTEDSFNENLAPLLAEEFPMLYRVDGFRLAEGLVREHKPQVLIEQFVERKLMCSSPSC